MVLLTKLFMVLALLTFMAYVVLSVLNKLVLVLVVPYTNTNYFLFFILCNRPPTVPLAYSQPKGEDLARFARYMARQGPHMGVRASPRAHTYDIPLRAKARWGSP